MQSKRRKDISWKKLSISSWKQCPNKKLGSPQSRPNWSTNRKQMWARTTFTSISSTVPQTGRLASKTLKRRALPSVRSKVSSLVTKSLKAFSKSMVLSRFAREKSYLLNSLQQTVLKSSTQMNYATMMWRREDAKKTNLLEKTTKGRSPKDKLRRAKHKPNFWLSQQPKLIIKRTNLGYKKFLNWTE